MNATEHGVAFAVTLFIGMLASIEIGRRIGLRRLARGGTENKPPGLVAMEGSMFGLFGLLLAFTFYGAAARFDARRLLVIEEANHIENAYGRIDLLPPETQPALRELFRQYLDSRIETYQKLPNITAAMAGLKHSAEIQRKIWDYSIVACRESDSSPAHMLLLSALNQMNNIMTVRTQVTKIHPPWIIFALLGLASLVSSLLAGYGMAESRSRNWLHALAFTILISLTVYVIIDIEHPHLGLFRVDNSDEVLLQLREKIN